jgi:multidrug transporter EmrE-like cation transporter
MSMTNVVMLSLAEIIGDFGYESFADTGSKFGFAQGSVGYIGVVYFLIKTLKSSSIMWTNGMWDGVSGIIETIAAYVLLGERLDSWVQYMGIVLIAGGLVLLKTGGGRGD